MKPTRLSLLGGAADKVEPVVLGVIGEILCVKRCQRYSVNKAAGSDPTIVDRAGTAAKLGVGLQFTPPGCNRLIEGEQDDPLSPACQVG